MKKIIQGAALTGVLFVLAGCATGTVDDKRAPGYPGHKTFQVQVHNHLFVGPKLIWVTVTEKQWDQCELGESLSACR